MNACAGCRWIRLVFIPAGLILYLMLDVIKLIDRAVPIWEIFVIGLAMFGIVLVLVLWWAFGYNLIVVPEPTAVVKPAALAASLL